MHITYSSSRFAPIPYSLASPMTRSVSVANVLEIDLVSWVDARNCRLSNVRRVYCSMFLEIYSIGDHLPECSSLGAAIGLAMEKPTRPRRKKVITLTDCIVEYGCTERAGSVRMDRSDIEHAFWCLLWRRRRMARSLLSRMGGQRLRWERFKYTAEYKLIIR